MPARLAKAGAAVLLAVPLATAACSDVRQDLFGPSTAPRPGQVGFLTGFIGGVVADEPQAAAVGRDVLSAGGTAADAAVALGFALSVSLPSRAGLGGGGACLVYMPGARSPNHGVPEALLFVPPAPARPAATLDNGAVIAPDRPAAVPMLARGLFALHRKYGNRVFEQLISPAEYMARHGIGAARAFVRDLAVVAGPLAADPAARGVFFSGGQPIAEGAQFLQPALSATLGTLRTKGVGDFYQGELAHRVADAARDAGGGLSLADLRDALPTWAPALSVAAGKDSAMFLPPPADGGLAAAAAFQVLQHDPQGLAAADARALAVAASWRRMVASGHPGDPRAVLGATTVPAAGAPMLPASTTFVTLDRRGMAVVCALTMNNLFGTGRVAAGTGMLLAASPAWQTPPLLSAAIAYGSDRGAFRAAVGGTGQAGAPLAVAVAMRAALADHGAVAHPLSTPVPDPGRANVMQCNQYLPGDPGSCGWATDARGAGVALGSIPR
jgi:gamma-glutamyltranspeptidase/glutathione hydrolase